VDKKYSREEARALSEPAINGFRTDTEQALSEILDALDLSENRIKRALAMYDQAFPVPHAGLCSDVACQMARTLRR
jgi:hypothetical protein